jgi:hypothetical protein
MIAGCLSDYNSKPVLRVEKGRIIFKLDKRWSQDEKKEVIGQYDLDSSLVEKAFSGKGEVMIDSVLWQYKSINPFFAELSKPLDNRSGDFLQKNEVLIINDSWIKKPFFVSGPLIVSGINDFKKPNAFSYKDGFANFFLPGHKDASNVYLSGTFNDWSTMQAPMFHCDSGWIFKIKIQPGKYLYKYIVDGNWHTDPNNKLEERNNQGSNNSVVFCYNHRFELKSKKDAKKVIVTGNFTNWSRDRYQMKSYQDGWYFDIYLKEGNYSYKYIADGNWMTDPANPYKTGSGNYTNSFMTFKPNHTFVLEK